MKIAFFAVLALLLSAHYVEARIGEDFDQCVKRYGNPMTNDSGLKLLDQRTGLEIRKFKKDSVPVKIIFNENKAIYIEYDYNTLKLETGESSAVIIKKLLDLNGKDWTFDKTSIDRDWLLEDNDNEGVIASDRIEPGLAKDRWVSNGGPEKGGLIAVKAAIFGTLIIANAEYMALVIKNQPRYYNERGEKVKKALESF